MHKICLTIFVCVLVSCAKVDERYTLVHDRHPDPHSIPNLRSIADATPKNEPRSRLGNPESYAVNNRKYQVLKSSRGYQEKGMASWYGVKFHGHNTSNGEVYDMYAMTAAHKSLPLPTYARVTNLENNRSVIVKINDRGPFHGNRIIDLSYAAAYKLGMLKSGTAKVKVQAIDTSQLAPSFSTPRYIQLGAFRDQRNASQLIKSLNELSLQASLEKQNNWYRVTLGPISKQQEFDKITDTLAKANIDNVLIQN